MPLVCHVSRCSDGFGCLKLFVAFCHLYRGGTILQLKATPLVATITVVEIYSVSSHVRSDTFIVYEPLLLLAAFYVSSAGIITLMLRCFEKQVPGL